MSDINLKRCVKISGPLNLETLETAEKEIKRLSIEDEQKDIDLLIGSSGGRLEPTLSFIDFVLHGIKPKIKTFSFGRISSMAIPLFLVGQERFITPSAVFFFHPIFRAFNKETELTLGGIKEELRSLENAHSMYVKVITDRSRCSDEKANQLISCDNFIYPEEIVQLGLAHEILK